MRVIARFSPAAFEGPRSFKGRKSWDILERGVQNELYCYLKLKLFCLPILPEHSHDQDDRIDFYVPDRERGIEVQQCGTPTTIAEDVDRFQTGGNNHDWHIMSDYMILIFCPRSALPWTRV